MRKLLLFLRTLRHLKPIQVAYLPLRRLQRGRAPALPVLLPDLATERFPLLAEELAVWGPGDAQRRVEKARQVVSGTFEFLNHSESIPRVDWNRRYVSHLWSYNLHYFEYGVDLAWAYRTTGSGCFADKFFELAESWAVATRPGIGDGWEPYPISVRIINWIYALLLFGDAIEARNRDLLWTSLFLQARLLERRLELHLQANHLQKNLQALVLAGNSFKGPEAERWRRMDRWLWCELQEQVLPDGGHFERSPMYHALALTDYLQTAALLRAVGEVPPEDAVAAMHRMVGALRMLVRPNGSLHLFNDSANGIAPAREEIESLASRVLGETGGEPLEAVALPETGYYGYFDPSTCDRLLIDCGEPGPSYQSGHAHCDLLSFELDLRGHPVVVDSGVCGYDADPLREYVRSTRAHNTITISSREQSEVWGAFRMARRARVLSAAQERGNGWYRFTGSYSPYHSRKVVHRRTVEREEHGWTVLDEVEGSGRASLQSFLHLHPDFECTLEGNRVYGRSAALSFTLEFINIDEFHIRAGEREPVQGWYCPEFGRAVPAQVIEMHVNRASSQPFGYRILIEEDTCN